MQILWFTTQEQRKVQDKFCHICEVCDKLISEVRKLYDLGPYGTINEMLLKFRGQCNFRQYMPSKPGRHGIKFWILTDAQNCYCYVMPYLGKDGDKVAINLGATVVKKLVEPLHNSGRNVTCDQYIFNKSRDDWNSQKQ